MRLNAPIPGANYMADTRNYAWHRPPDMVDYDEAVSYLIDKIDEPEEKELIFAMLGIDAHITTVVTVLLLQAVSKGKIGIDLAVLIAGPVARYIEIAAKNAGVKYEMGVENKDRIIITPTLLKASLGIIDEEEELEQPLPEEPAPEAPADGLMAMPEAGAVAPEEEQAAMLGGVEEEEPEDEL
jgi:hypothetical protein